MELTLILGGNCGNLLRHLQAQQKNFTGFEASKRVEEIGWSKQKKKKKKGGSSDITLNLYGNRISNVIQMESALGEEVLE